MVEELFRAGSGRTEGGGGSPQPLTPGQVEALKKPLEEARVQRRADGLPYLPAYDVIETANRIFGFGGWERAIKRLEKIYEEELEGVVSVGYLCEYRIRVGGVAHEDVGFGSSSQGDRARAHETALKGAVSDALKRCFRAFGDQFGLSLYKPHEEAEAAPAGVRLATEAQLGRLRRELRAYGLSEQELLEFVNARMNTAYARLEELPLRVASRAIDRFEKDREKFAQAIKAAKGKEL